MGRGVRLAMTGTTADDEITLPVGGTAPASKADFIRIDVFSWRRTISAPGTPPRTQWAKHETTSALQSGLRVRIS